MPLSKSLGPYLPDRLYADLQNGRLFRTGGLGLAVLTIDEQGWPHVAMAPGAVAHDRDRLVVALGGSSKSLQYALRTGQATLLIAGPETLYYAKGRVELLCPSLEVIPQEAALLLHLTDLLSDVESFVQITGGISYRYSLMQEEYITVINALLDELQALAEAN